MAEWKRDKLGEISAVLSLTSGRDKFIRIAQSLAKFFKSRCDGVKGQEENARLLGRIMESMGVARRVLRFGRHIDSYRAMRKAWAEANKTSTLNLPSTLDTLANFCASWFLFFDHILFFIYLGVYKPEKAVADKINRWTDMAWMGELVCTCLAAILRLEHLSKQTGTLIERNKFAQQRIVARTTLDLGVVLNNMKYIGESNPGIFGLIGALSASIQIFDMWPTLEREIGRAVQQECRDRSRMPSSA
eukprot:TRINITY_DN4391_c0_g1_i10.p1 TRINITY_DN4391_c0_g1~~TRINITY_DN4391_c0_g1_i10.p1  ORF type:complete len:246 (-),score=21.67 TRINITY_DN4391_c0_g1_i10:11-748(-)